MGGNRPAHLANSAHSRVLLWVENGSWSRTNHVGMIIPRGAAELSRANELLTQTLKTALALVDVRVLDHLVMAGTEVTSFAERGLI